MQKILALAWLFLLAPGHPAGIAATLPAGFSEKPLTTSLSSPTAMAFAPDGRLFVCQQGGSLRVIKAGTLLAKPFLTLNVDSNGERGLLGVAFDPQFASNHLVYVYYTAKSPAVHNRVSRFTASGDTALAGSEQILLDLDDLSSATNHNGGAIHFGPDGMMYIGVGENANSSNSQTTGNLLGKILRMMPDGGVPSDNPFVATASGKNRMIWALGLRNPFTFAFQPNTGALFINDVGNSSWEEINKGVAGVNYGWPATEGFTTNPLYRGPLYTYPHGAGTAAGNCIAGGAFYNPLVVTYPASYSGKYFFADYVNNWIKTLTITDSTATVFATNVSGPVDLQLGPDGNLYYLARGAGAVYVVQYSATDVGEEENALPATIDLEQNYPNPFNPVTTLVYTIGGLRNQASGFSRVMLTVYDPLGRVIAPLVDEEQPAGTYTVRFDAGGLASGTYLVRLNAAGQVRTRRVLLIR